MSEILGSDQKERQLVLPLFAWKNYLILRNSFVVLSVNNFLRIISKNVT